MDNLSYTDRAKAIREEGYEDFKRKLDDILFRGLDTIRTRNAILDSAWSLVHDVSGNKMQHLVIQEFTNYKPL